MVREEETTKETWAVDGSGNILPLGAILIAVFLPVPWREIVMEGCCGDPFMAIYPQYNSQKK